EKALFANDFLEKSKQNKIKPGKKIVIIGAGNVGCDVATEAHRLGAKIITLIDIQKPLAFGKEKEDAEAVGAIFKWPCFTEKITKKGVLLQDGELLEADNVIISIGDIPDLDFLGDALACKNGFVSVDEFYRTSDPRVFAIGDAVGPGLITDAIGAGKRTAQAIDTIISGHDLEPEKELVPISLERVSLAYYNPLKKSDTLKECSEDCASCGQCRDCSVCVTVCPEGAITRVEKNDGDYEYKVVDDLCIGCGFCQGACPCGIWYLIANDPL
ncbi:MAG: FAD-dependent oxidoreductase, partial [Desulfobacteraceae bacterium]|nr:FAD-dependent oxidoreductase [Desulfobacteraceae bacterium]